ncbi:GDSL-type esterase/lipase family protein [Streptomyces sp. NPDC050504]|uniref:GDSL-type esterase/lipase family protein n=1 Tax=Streptomyces sp. NPDC050504 TaxID=3365618 RepID=UPI003793C16B
MIAHPAPSLVVAGDSVAAERPGSRTALAGWGQYLGEHLGAGTQVVNTSKDSFTAAHYFTHRLPTVLDGMRPGDVFLFCFGVCDQAIARPDLYATPEEYTAYAHLYVDQLRERSLTPVFVTQPSRHIFGPSGALDTASGDYSPHLRRVAADRNCVLVDLQQSTRDLFGRMGPERARGYFRWFEAGEKPQEQPRGIVDTLHFNPQGARAVAQLAARELSRAGLSVRAEAAGDVPPPRAMPWDAGRARRRLAEAPDEPRTAAAPVVLAPADGAAVAPTPRLRGTAPAKAGQVVFLSGGEVLGATPVADDGSWLWRRPTAWPVGTHRVEVVAIGPSGRSLPGAVRFEVAPPLPPPEVTKPEAGSTNGPRPVFRGTAAPGTSKVVALSEGRFLGESPVDGAGAWRFKLPHDWRPGRHEVRFLAVRNGIPSAPLPHPFTAVAIPSSHWLRRDPEGWVHCAPGRVCPHIKRERPEGARRMLD